MDAEKLFHQFVKNVYSDISSDDELQNDDRIRMKERNKKYSEVLDAYVSNTKKVLWIKLVFRVIFLLVSMGALVGIFVVFCAVLWWAANGKIEAGYLETVVTIISSMAAMMTVFIVLPKIMTKYLFDVEEEKNIYNIVKQIQDYDQVIRENLR
ncbi:MAG: hypothetical protein HFH59_10035 [Lachnospiraceae bacterium]|nr:hypothetical protein [Lachnospiraceae bacterium]